MNERQAFLDHIIDNPEDDVARLVFADWLEEHGEEERAEFIRIQCALAEKEREAMDRDLKKVRSLQRQEKFLLQKIHKKVEGFEWTNAGWWSWPLGSMDNEYQERFHRGFIDTVVCDLESWIKYSKILLQTNPIQTITITDKEPHHDPEQQKWMWIRSGAAQEIPKFSLYILPQDIFDFLDPIYVRPFKENSQVRWADQYPSEEIAIHDLNQACIQWARNEPRTKGESHRPVSLHYSVG
jgi:uncharacterized protein (TIGR02996 family)